MRVDLDERGYDIYIGEAMAEATWGAAKPGTRMLIVSDTNVDPLYGDACEALLSERGAVVSRLTVPAGEPSKDLAFVRGVYDRCFEAGLDRRSVLVALGGGMVGDLTGFAAASFMRGVRFIQVPTTLLAMVDSSVGGKTGVNVPQGKNLIGAFHQPVEVVADLTTLDTLPEREYLSGLGEVVKYGIIWDAGFFAFLESNVDALRQRDKQVIAELVARSCEIKAEVVAMDEREGGVRAILNFGHTFAHAVEKELGYGKLLHGEAVAVGMAYAAELSVKAKGMPEAQAKRLVDLLKALSLPVCGADIDEPLGWDALRVAMNSDKKARDSIPLFVLAEKLGGVHFGCEVSEPLLEAAYRALFS